MSAMYIWVCREDSTWTAFKAVADAIEASGPMRYSTVRILPVSEDRGVTLPDGLTDANGQPLPSGVVTLDNCPAAGILAVTGEDA